MPRKWTDEEIFIKNSPVSRNYIRKFIISKQLLPYVCSKCGIYKWNNRSISLYLNYINGDKTDNELSNLRWLCPNCYTQIKIRKRTKKYVNKVVLRAKDNIDVKKDEINWPSMDDLVTSIRIYGYPVVSRKLGISGGIIREYVKEQLKSTLRSRNED
jgi:hypothetical protein